MRRIIWGVFVLIGVCRLASAFDVTACGQTVPAGEIGELQTDLSCMGAFVVGVGAGGALHLDGHTLQSSGSQGVTDGVVCLSDCVIEGPGTITATDLGVQATSSLHMTLENLTIRNTDLGLVTDARTRLTVSHVTIADNHTYGINSGVLSAVDLTVTGNGGTGIALARTLRGEMVTVSDNGSEGIFAARVVVSNLTATGNGGSGVRAGRASLKDSTLTGNDGFGAGIDVTTKRKPRVRDTTCGKSQKIGAQLGDDWGVCTGD